MATKRHKSTQRASRLKNWQSAIGNRNFVYVPFVPSCGPSLETIALTSGGTARPFASSSGGAGLDLIWLHSPVAEMAPSDFFTNGNGRPPSDLRESNGLIPNNRAI